jgi:hypothetical protein
VKKVKTVETMDEDDDIFQGCGVEVKLNAE